MLVLKMDHKNLVMMVHLKITTTLSTVAITMASLYSTLPQAAPPPSFDNIDLWLQYTTLLQAEENIPQHQKGAQRT